MELTHLWTVVCQKSLIDTDTNLLSLVDIVEEIEFKFDEKEKKTKEQPVIFPIQYEVITYWINNTENEVAKYEIVVENVDPQGETLKTFKYNLIFQEGKRRMRARVRMNGFGIKGYGTYEIRVKYRDEGSDEYRIAGNVPIDVKEIKV